MSLTINQVEENIKSLGGKIKYDNEFIFDLLAAYGRSQTNIARLRNGKLNIADNSDIEVAQKDTVYFKPSIQTNSENLYLVIDDLKSSPPVVRFNTRFVIVTDYKKLLSIDLKTGETLDINIRDIDKHYAFFLPWAGMEKAQFISESHADVKAAEKMAKLFDSLIKFNGYKTAEDWHTLNTFFTRLLFCFFAEDVNIFKKNQFTNAIISYTQKDGSDLKIFLTDLFKSLDDYKKDKYPSHFSEFPYVNGRLFRDSKVIPVFNKESRDLLIESSSKLDWSSINPDIFGSMFQAVVRPGKRIGLGQHYTSVPNILKTIEPLFLDELKESFDKSYDDPKKLKKLLDRISKIKVFDPACGSGNFLIIAYKELRKLEHAILERRGELLSGTQQVLFGSTIDIKNFYGIEIDDFACEVAILSLWLAKHQMNIEFAQKFGVDIPLIPLKEAGNIIHGNAAKLEWEEICPSITTDEVFITGNPPYAGSSMQNLDQKQELANICKGFDNYKNLDYISIWFIKAAQYIRKHNAKVGFVSTNSISQGEHVSLLWPHIIDQNLCINFARTSFKWANNAKHNAGVVCVIIGLAKRDNDLKKIFIGQMQAFAKNINAYLLDSDDIYIPRRAKPISDIPEMVYGNKPTDGGYLILDESELNELVHLFPKARKYIKKYVGSEDLMNNIKRYCLWIEDIDLEDARSIPLIEKRFKAVEIFRKASKAKSTNEYAKFPNRFKQRTYKRTNSIIIPRVTSERREYIPIDYLGEDTVISDAAFAMYNAEPWVFGVISSKMHAIWVKTVAGKLKTDVRYSSALAYNNFPVPMLTSDNQSIISKKVMAILDSRQNHTEKTLGQLYDPEKMPDDLRIAHQELDNIIDSIYRRKPFVNDEERLACLFSLYEKMIGN